MRTPSTPEAVARCIQARLALLDAALDDAQFARLVAVCRAKKHYNGEHALSEEERHAKKLAANRRHDRIRRERAKNGRDCGPAGDGDQ